LLGYLVPWPWNGSTGNTLWDWLGLLLLPLVMATAKAWSDIHENLGVRHRVVAMVPRPNFASRAEAGIPLQTARPGPAGRASL